MSGEGEVVLGILALPFIAAAGAGWLAFQTGKAIVNGAVAINNYAKEAKRQRELELNSVEGELNQSIRTLNSVTSQFNDRFDNLIKETSENFTNAGNEMMQKSKSINTGMIEKYSQTLSKTSDDMRQKFQKDYASISREYADKIAVNTKKLKEKMQSSLNESRTEVEKLRSDRTAYMNKSRSMADEAIRSAEQYIKYIKEHSVINNTFADKIHTLEFNINEAKNHFNNEMYDASYASAQNLKFVALDILNDMLIEKNEVESYKTMLLFEISKLKSIVSQNSEIKFDYDGVTIKGNIYDYSEGLMQGFKSSVERIENEINNKNLSLKDFKNYYRKVTDELLPSFTRIWNWSVKNLENAYMRKDIAQTITETIENQNFEMIESGYKGDSETNDLYIKFRNNTTSEEIMVIVKPEDKPGTVGTKYEVHQLTNGVTPNRQEEIRLDINRGVMEYYDSHDMKISPCAQATIGKPSRLSGTNISDVKKSTQKRSPMI